MPENEDRLPINVADVSFDPLREPPRDVDAEEAAPSGHVIVQLGAPLTPDERARLQSQYGLRLSDCLPEQAYVETLDAATLARLTADPAMVRQRCGRVGARGCLDPPAAGVEVVLKYVDPLGNVTFHTVTTDEKGCFEDFVVSVNGGTWQVSAEYAGGKCEAPVTEGPVTVCWCRG